MLYQAISTSTKVRCPGRNWPVHRYREMVEGAEGGRTVRQFRCGYLREIEAGGEHQHKSRNESGR
jgi:hypothetical protein